MIQNLDLCSEGGVFFVKKSMVGRFNVLERVGKEQRRKIFEFRSSSDVEINTVLKIPGAILKIFSRAVWRHLIT